MPLKIYKRGDTWHCRGTVGGQLVRESLRTRDKALAGYKSAQIQAKLEKEAVFGKREKKPLSQTPASDTSKIIPLPVRGRK